MARYSVFSIFSICSSLLYPVMSYALPMYGTTTPPLPTDKAMSADDKPDIDFVVGLTYHQDHQDKNKFYYTPKFKAVEYAEGSASFLKNEEVVSSYSNLQALSASRYNLAVSEYDAAQKLVISLQNTVAAAIDSRDPNLSLYQEALKNTMRERDKAAEKATKYESILPAGIIKAMNIRAADLLSFVGFPVKFGEDAIGKEAREEILSKTSDLSKANGGLFTSNITSGFTDKEIASLRNYKTKYAPSVTLSVMPVENLSFESLTELQYSASNKKTVSQAGLMFNAMEGGGGLSGATINFDLSTLGATALAKYVGPFILPVRVKGRLKQQMPPFHAKLHCDFRNGWSLKGRADVRDGLVIFNNDLNNNFKAEDNNDGGCKLNLISGDVKAAQYKALQELEKSLTDLYVERVKLSKKDKEDYWKSVEQDVQANRHRGANDGYGNVFMAYQASGWQGAAIVALGASSQFYWHTNTQNVEMLSKVVLDKDIEENGYENVEMPMDVSVCFVFNKLMNAYRTCSSDEAKKALPLTDAAFQAQKSLTCVGITDANECGKKRQVDAPALPNGNVVNPNPDI